jgi:23S rRNA (uracil1939-C5)-methyltransferase
MDVNTPGAACPHASVCSGCLLGPGRPVIERALAFFKGIDGYTLVQGASTGWRTRARLAVRRQHGALFCGLFSRGSHEVVSIPLCVVHHPKINAALPTIFSLPPHLAYDEHSHEGQLRYVQLFVERRTGLVQLTLVINSSNFSGSQIHEWERWAKELYSNAPDRWHSFWINLQPKATNTIFGPQWKHVCGRPLIWEDVCGRQIPILPSHFSQANFDMFERLLYDLLLVFPKGQRVAELYGGMGVIGCVLSSKSQSVTVVEKDADSSGPFLEARRRLPPGTNIEHIVGDVDDHLDVLDDATVVVVDPPRKGLSQPLLRALEENKHITALFYISCHFETLERDARLLRDRGFRITWARSYLFFPGTDQIETLARFERE